MKTYCVFVEDRGPGLFSALMEIEAKHAKGAERIAKKSNPPNRQEWGVEQYHAVEWPVATRNSNEWLDRHVNRERAA